jgi:PAS domain S-box-containing protein
MCGGLHAARTGWIIAVLTVATACEGALSSRGLSQREDDVLSLSMAGLGDKEIAAALGLSIHTVRSYWDRIRNRVGKGTRAEVIAEVSRLRCEQSALSEADRRLAQAQAKGAELEEILGQAPMIVWACDPSGRITYANEQFKLFSGSSGDELIEEAADRALPTEMRRPVHEAAAEARGRGAVFEYEMPLHGHDCEPRWHLIREVPIYDDAGDVKMRVGAAIDIDELHRRESLANVRANRHRLAADISETGVAYCDPTTGTYYSNAAYESLTGSGISERPWTEVVHPADRLLVAEQWAQAVRAGKPLLAELRYLKADGSVARAKARALPFPGGGWIMLTDKPAPAQTGSGDSDQLARLAMVLSDILGLDRVRPH